MGGTLQRIDARVEFHTVLELESGFADRISDDAVFLPRALTAADPAVGAAVHVEIVLHGGVVALAFDGVVAWTYPRDHVPPGREAGAGVIVDAADAESLARLTRMRRSPGAGSRVRTPGARLAQRRPRPPVRVPPTLFSPPKTPNPAGTSAPAAEPPSPLLGPPLLAEEDAVWGDRLTMPSVPQPRLMGLLVDQSFDPTPTPGPRLPEDILRRAANAHAPVDAEFNASAQSPREFLGGVEAEDALFSEDGADAAQAAAQKSDARRQPDDAGAALTPRPRGDGSANGPSAPRSAEGPAVTPRLPVHLRGDPHVGGVSWSDARQTGRSRSDADQGGSANVSPVPPPADLISLDALPEAPPAPPAAFESRTTDVDNVVSLDDRDLLADALPSTLTPASARFPSAYAGMPTPGPMPLPAALVDAAPISSEERDAIIEVTLVSEEGDPLPRALPHDDNPAAAGADASAANDAPWQGDALRAVLEEISSSDIEDLPSAEAEALDDGDAVDAPRGDAVETPRITLADRDSDAGDDGSATRSSDGLNVDEPGVPQGAAWATGSEVLLQQAEPTRRPDAQTETFVAGHAPVHTSLQLQDELSGDGPADGSVPRAEPISDPTGDAVHDALHDTPHSGEGALDIRLDSDDDFPAAPPPRVFSALMAEAASDEAEAERASRESATGDHVPVAVLVDDGAPVDGGEVAHAPQSTVAAEDDVVAAHRRVEPPSLLQVPAEWDLRTEHTTELVAALDTSVQSDAAADVAPRPLPQLPPWPALEAQGPELRGAFYVVSFRRPHDPMVGLERFGWPEVGTKRWGALDDAREAGGDELDQAVASTPWLARDLTDGEPTDSFAPVATDPGLSVSVVVGRALDATKDADADEPADSVFSSGEPAPIRPAMRANFLDEPTIEMSELASDEVSDEDHDTDIELQRPPTRR